MGKFQKLSNWEVFGFPLPSRPSVAFEAACAQLRNINLSVGPSSLRACRAQVFRFRLVGQWVRRWDLGACKPSFCFHLFIIIYYFPEKANLRNEEAPQNHIYRHGFGTYLTMDRIDVLILNGHLHRGGVFLRPGRPKYLQVLQRCNAPVGTDPVQQQKSCKTLESKKSVGKLSNKGFKKLNRKQSVDFQSAYLSLVDKIQKGEEPFLKGLVSESEYDQLEYKKKLEENNY